jgi:hypothetical protein
MTWISGSVTALAFVFAFVLPSEPGLAVCAKLCCAAAATTIGTASDAARTEAAHATPRTLRSFERDASHIRN